MVLCRLLTAAAAPTSIMEGFWAGPEWAFPHAVEAIACSACLGTVWFWDSPITLRDGSTRSRLQNAMTPCKSKWGRPLELLPLALRHHCSMSMVQGAKGWTGNRRHTIKGNTRDWVHSCRSFHLVLIRLSPAPISSRDNSLKTFALSSKGSWFCSARTSNCLKSSHRTHSRQLASYLATMSRSRAPLYLGLAAAGGVGYYLYNSGGKPKVAEKQFES